MVTLNIVLSLNYFLRYPDKTFLCIGLDDFITTYFYTRRGIPFPPPDTIVIRRFLTLSPLDSFFRGVNAVRGLIYEKHLGNNKRYTLVEPSSFFKLSFLSSRRLRPSLAMTTLRLHNRRSDFLPTFLEQTSYKTYTVSFDIQPNAHLHSCITMKCMD